MINLSRLLTLFAILFLISMSLFNRAKKESSNSFLTLDSMAKEAMATCTENGSYWPSTGPWIYDCSQESITYVSTYCYYTTTEYGYQTLCLFGNTGCINSSCCETYSDVTCST